MNAHDITTTIDTLDYEIADVIDSALNLDMGMAGRQISDIDFEDMHLAQRTLEAAVRSIAARLHVDAVDLLKAINDHVSKERSAILNDMLA